MCCPQCSGANCYFTIYHTQAYRYSAAQELLQRIQCRDSGIAPLGVVRNRASRNRPMSDAFRTCVLIAVRLRLNSYLIKRGMRCL